MTAVVLQFIFRRDTDVVHVTTNRTEMHIYKSDNDGIMYIHTINFNLTPLSIIISLKYVNYCGPADKSSLYCVSINEY